jgi:NAD(P)H-hydrate epimerase
MKLFTARQISGIDKYTIEHEPVLDIDLMERAALQITNWIIRHFDAGYRFLFFAGPGNNGGDALAVARQLADLDYYCEVWLLSLGHELQGSPAINRQRLIDQGRVQLHEIRSISDLPRCHPGDVLVDGLFGSGLSRPLEGVPAAVVKEINLLSN